MHEPMGLGAYGRVAGVDGVRTDLCPGQQSHAPRARTFRGQRRLKSEHELAGNED
jgi:hypothetical protein